MDTATCDICDGDLLGQDVRYVVDIKVYAAYDPLEITQQDLERDIEGELIALIRALRQKVKTAADAQALTDSVYKSFRFDLCLTCQRKYIADPLSPLRGRAEVREERKE